MIVDHYAQMLAFAWSSEAGSFSAAARAHDLTPSAISKLVSKLEKRLQVMLFVRGTKSLTLTDEGLAYREVARKVLDVMHEAESLGEALPVAASGTLCIHTMATFAKHQIARWLPEFLAENPDLSIDLKVGPQFVDLFDQGVDIAIHSGLLPNSSRVARKIGTTRWIYCASPAYIARSPTLEEPDDLARHQCFNFDFKSPWNSWSFSENGEIVVVPVVCRASFAQGDLLRDMALAGAGIVRLADFHIGEDLASGALQVVLKEFETDVVEPIYMVYPSRRNLSPRIRVFRDFLEKKITEHPWSVPR